MNLIGRVLKASPERPTRLHDLRGQRIDMASVPLIPAALVETAVQTMFRSRRATPWISYRATWQLGRMIRRDWRIVEFGAGMSTIWFASRAQFVLSIESDPGWFNRVRMMLEKRGVTNVQLEYRAMEDCEQYASLGAEKSFDLALIDGHCRDRCVAPCMRAVRNHGYIYLDNTDQPGDRQTAEALLLAQPLAWHQYFNDFAPGLVAITQGLLVRLT
jgi:predicted O-methyltransferase YrrM